MKQSNKYPLKLRVTFQRKSEYYQTVFDLSKDEWKKLPASRISNELVIVRKKLKEIETTASIYIDQIESFGLEEFEKSFIQSNPYFRKRKQKLGFINDSSSKFDYKPFHKKFFILLEEPSKPGLISYSYLIS